MGMVVPYRGTWVETCNKEKFVDARSVVPYRGTWVETGDSKGVQHRRKSYLIEVRGLKQVMASMVCTKAKVVPYRGTWVETTLEKKQYQRMQSYLIEVRGLKPVNRLVLMLVKKSMSYLIEVRGLKPVSTNRIFANYCRTL